MNHCVVAENSLLNTYPSLFFFSIPLWRSLIQFLFSGLTDDPSSSKNGIKTNAHASSSGNTGLRVVLICVGVVAVVAFSVFLFKQWQKKKREEQHARLLRLFEEDDELELELGLRE